MVFDTIGFNYYIGCIFRASVTEGISCLQQEEAKDYYKIIYIKNGPCHFLLNGKEFIMTGPSAICMNEKDRISFLDVKEDLTRILWFHPCLVNGSFSFETINHKEGRYTSTDYQDLYYLNQFTYEAKETMKILNLFTFDSSAIDYKIQQLKDLLEKQNTNFWPCRSRSYLFEILFTLARQEEDEEVAATLLHYEGRSRLIIDVIYYLQSTYNKKITLEKLSEEFHTNRTTLLNDFRKYTGQTVNNYLIQLRLMMASTLLRDTELPVEEICDRTGFNDISYFSKVFKKKLYCTPSEYRKLNHPRAQTKTNVT